MWDSSSSSSFKIAHICFLVFCFALEKGNTNSQCRYEAVQGCKAERTEVGKRSRF